MRTTLCTVASVPTACRSAGLGESRRGIDLGGHDDGPLFAQRLDQLDGALPANGKRQNGMRKQNGIADRQNGNPAHSGVQFFRMRLFRGGDVEGWFGIECPLINFPSLDNASMKSFRNLLGALVCLPKSPRARGIRTPANRFRIASVCRPMKFFPTRAPKTCGSIARCDLGCRMLNRVSAKVAGSENKRPCKKDFAKENVTDQWCTSNGGDELELSKNLAPLGEMRNRVATTI